MSTPPQGWIDPVTNWTVRRSISYRDLNRIEGNEAAIETGARTVSTFAPLSDTGTLREFLDRFVYKFIGIMGTPTWYQQPPISLREFNDHVNSAAGVHGLAQNLRVTGTISGLYIVGFASAAVQSAYPDVTRIDVTWNRQFNSIDSVAATYWLSNTSYRYELRRLDYTVTGVSAVVWVNGSGVTVTANFIGFGT